MKIKIIKILKTNRYTTIAVILILFITLTSLIFNIKKTQHFSLSFSNSGLIIKSNSNNLTLTNTKNNSQAKITSSTTSNSVSNIYNPANASTIPLQSNSVTENQSPSNLQSGPNYNNPNISSKIN